MGKAEQTPGKGSILYLSLQNTEKHHFVQRALRYLGSVVSAQNTCPNPAKADAVAGYPVPREELISANKLISCALNFYSHTSCTYVNRIHYLQLFRAWGRGGGFKGLALIFQSQYLVDNLQYSLQYII